MKKKRKFRRKGFQGLMELIFGIKTLEEFFKIGDFEGF
jgi:hypothetical protein